MLAARNLLRNPLRTALTVVGVALGIAMLVSVSGYGRSVGTQLQNAIDNRYQLILQSPGVSSPLSSSIPESDLKLLDAIDGIEEALPLVIGSLKTEKIRYFVIIGVTSNAALSGNISLSSGQWQDSNGGEILLGKNAARQLQLETGELLELPRERLRVSGQFNSESSILNHAGILALADAQRLLGRQDKVNAILLRLDPEQGIKSLSARIAAAVPRLNLTRSVDLLGRLELFVVIERVTGALGLIAILFSILIVTNTLMMSVTERKREFAILIAIGWSRAMIARSLLMESLTISLFGSLSGLLIGSWVLDFYSHSDVPGINWGAPSLSAADLILTFAITLAVASLSALYPVFVTSRWSAARILRRE